MTSIALNNRAPYKTCVTHGFVVDLDGKKISKSSAYEKPVDADHFVNEHGADLVRLWASSINYTDDVPFSEEMFTRLGDTYRRIRNTLRILLGNLYDFEAGGANLPNESFTLVDRWILERLVQVIGDCRTAYESFEFHKVYHVINQFCAVDLSSLTSISPKIGYSHALVPLGAALPRQRCARSLMASPLARPDPVFTADEAWQHAKASGSIHLQEFPQQEQRGDKVTGQVTELLRLRGVIGQAIEKARQDKLIGNALEAAVVLNSNSSVTSEIDKDELEEFFILSDLTVQPATEASAVVTQTAHKKCARCWRHRPSVGTSAAYPDLCDRCEAVVRRATN